MTTNNCDWYEGCLRAGKHQCPACGEWFCSAHLDESGYCFNCCIEMDDDGCGNSDDPDLTPYRRDASGMVD